MIEFDNQAQSNSHKKIGPILKTQLNFDWLWLGWMAKLAYILLKMIKDDNSSGSQNDVLVKLYQSIVRFT